MLLDLLNQLLEVHNVFGCLCLISFWLVVFMKKGTLIHKRIGKIYFYTLSVVCFTSIVNGVVRVHFMTEDPSYYKFPPHFYSLLFIGAILAFVPMYTGIKMHSTHKQKSKIFRGAARGRTTYAPTSELVGGGDLRSHMCKRSPVSLLMGTQVVWLIAISPMACCAVCTDAIEGLSENGWDRNGLDRSIPLPNR